MTAAPPASPAPDVRGASPRTSRWRPRLRRAAIALALMAVIAPALQCALLNVIDPPLTLTMVGQSWVHWRASGEWRLPAREWIDLADLPRAVPVAALSTEDRSFFHHNGFEWQAIRRAWARHRTRPGARLVGGSTISQQVARNVFLTQHRSWLRKGLEAWYTVWLELLVPKHRILEVYLNVAEMGPMVFGVGAAATHWFGKPAARLRFREAALLMAMLPSPRRFTPRTPQVVRRAAWIERLPARYLRPPAE